MESWARHIGVVLLQANEAGRKTYSRPRRFCIATMMIEPTLICDE